MDNLTKTNDQLFSDYYYVISNTHTPKVFLEARRLLEQFREFLSQVPPSTNIALQFLTRFKDRKPNTRVRYAHVLGGFSNGTREAAHSTGLNRTSLLPCEQPQGQSICHTQPPTDILTHYLRYKVNAPTGSLHCRKNVYTWQKVRL